jgi:hypothetical protein
MQQSEQSATQLEINSRISRTLLGRRAALPNAPLTIRDAPRLAFLIRQFHRGVERQHQTDAATFSSVVRILNNGRSATCADVERFTAFVRSIVQEELESRGN